MKKKIRIHFCGSLFILDSDLRNKLYEIAEETKYFIKCKLNIAVGYDGRQEIKMAAKRCIMKDEYIKKLENNLDLKEDIDLVIRTGGERKMSGFFPWQTVDAEWVFLDIYWPEFSIDILKSVLDEYHERIFKRK